MEAVMSEQRACLVGVQQIGFTSEAHALSAMRMLQEQMQGEAVRAEIETDDDVINLVAELRKTTRG